MNPSIVQSKFVMVGDIRTHYLEAGQGEPLILLHSGEFGGCAEISWEYNIEKLSEHFHVFAPDWLGYGLTDKLFSFQDMFEERVKHIRRFMETLCIERAHFIGNSMGGSMLITVAAEEQPPWNMDKIVVVSGGGVAPENEAREILNSYDCTKEHMREIMKVIFAQERFWNDQAYIEKRYNASIVPGAWECTAAARFKSPAASVSGKRRPKTYGTIKSPTLIVAGAQDRLRYPGYADELAKQIPGAKLHVFEEAGHCSHIEFPDAFNKLVIDFLKE